ncbi:MAG TPA: putative Ig domain-containing protein, partial [Acidobacteriota bacterium]|nr:putative Ig domain-containing protein [Acidobacteriota bacterium]
LSWSNGGGATSYLVYFGTDSTPDSGEYKGEQSGRSYDPGTLNYDRTYYWRIDAKNSAGTTTGDVWRFTTGSAPPQPPSKATNPNPSHGATNRSINTNVSWSNGGGATSYRVYFGTDSTPDSTEFKGEQTGTSYDPGTLAYSTTYYWRIDAKNSAGTTTGDVWRFTTGSAGTNHDPILEEIPNGTVYVGVPYHHDANATDPDGDTLSYYLAGSVQPVPDSMVINETNGEINWTPTLQEYSDGLEWGNQWRIWVVVQDGKGGEDLEDFTLELKLEAVDSLTLRGHVTLTEGGALPPNVRIGAIHAEFSDYPADPVSIVNSDGRYELVLDPPNGNYAEPAFEDYIFYTIVAWVDEDNDNSPQPLPGGTERWSGLSSGFVDYYPSTNKWKPLRAGSAWVDGGGSCNLDFVIEE